MNGSAVILFVYNRPEHTRRVIEGLRRNAVEELYVFSDGPRTEADREAVEQTRELIRGISWCDVIPGFSEGNRGLADSVIHGVTSVFGRGYESVIVVEDDCVPDEQFLSFMQQAFQYYESQDEVMHISGFGLPIKKRTDADVYLNPYPCSWGWGTWAKYWRECDFHQTDAYHRLLGSKQERRRFNYPGEVFSDFLQMQLDQRINSWLIRWYFHIYSRGGKCVWSYDSHIRNGGFDGTGVHKVHFDRYNQRQQDSRIRHAGQDFRFEDDLQPDPALIREFRRYFNGKGLWEKSKTLLYMASGLLIEPIKIPR